MTLDEYKSKKAELETDLRDFIANRCRQFKTETGLSVQWITISMITLRVMGSLPDYLVESVRVDVPF